MRILLVGDGPALTWACALLDALSGEISETSRPQIVAMQKPLGREDFAAAIAAPVDALVLVGHSPFVDGPLLEEQSLNDVVRREASRAIFALELARRASRTLCLTRENLHSWSASLSELLMVPLPGPLENTQVPVSWTESAGQDPTLIHSYLMPLFEAVSSPAPLRLVWPGSVFFDGDAPGQFLPSKVEVAGRARILAYGPYLPLPPGSWQATACLGFSPDIGKLPFILEVDAGAAVSRGFFEVDCGGIFTLELDFKVSDYMHPVEFRLISQDSALEGQVALIEIEFQQANGSQSS